MPQTRLQQVGAKPESWVDDYGSPLFRYAMMQVSDPDVAEDLVQETFVAALGSYKSYTGKSSFLTWLTSILRRKIVDYRRRAARQQPVAGSEAVSEEPLFDGRNHWHSALGRWPSDPGRQLEDAEFWATFEKCLGQLPPTLAEAFRLREVMAWSMNDVCELVGISSGNLAVRLHRARLLLRGCLEKKWFRDAV